VGADKFDEWADLLSIAVSEALATDRLTNSEYAEAAEAVTFLDELGDRRNSVTVMIVPGLDGYDIELFQAVEKALNAALAQFGHLRSVATMSGLYARFTYRTCRE